MGEAFCGAEAPPLGLQRGISLPSGSWAGLMLHELHSLPRQLEEARAIEQEVGDAYRRGMSGSGSRAEATAQDESDAFWHYRDLPGDSWDLRDLAAHEKLEQVREVDGEAAYQARREALEWRPQVPSARLRPRDPERGGGIEH